MKPEIEIFCEGLDHPEGLAFGPDGSLYCGGEAGQIYRVAPDGKNVEVVGNTGGFNLGLAFSPEGWLLVCDCKQGTLWRFDPHTRQLDVFAKEINREPLGHLNFPVFCRDGSFFVSESGKWGQADGRVLHFSPSGEGTVCLREVDFPNGLALSADESTLFIVLSACDSVARAKVSPELKSEMPEIYASGLESVPDGLALDSTGTLFISCYGNNNIWKVQPDGSIELYATDPTSLLLNRATNIAFGGEDLKSLFVANLGGWHISRLPVATPGQRLAGKTL